PGVVPRRPQGRCHERGLYPEQADPERDRIPGGAGPAGLGSPADSSQHAAEALGPVRSSLICRQTRSWRWLGGLVCRQIGGIGLPSIPAVAVALAVAPASPPSPRGRLLARGFGG